MLCTVFVVSYVPILAKYTLEGVGMVKMSNRYLLFQQYTLSVNLIANPFIYTMTQHRFKVFLKELIRKSVPDVFVR